MGKITISSLNRMKAAGEKIAVITSYDASFTRQIERAGMDVILVGDSLGMVVQGHESTLPVTVDEMVYHTANVMRGSDRTMVIADMPFMSHATAEQALHTAGRLMKEGGAHMVKIEGGAPQLDTVRHLTARAVPVCGHLGLMPQSIHQLGAYKVQGRGEHAAERILKDAVGLQHAGAQMLVLECVPAVLAAEITKALDIPVIGIGAGVDVDGQVLVLYDMLGITSDGTPSFVRDFLADTGTINGALEAYVKAVKNQEFPAQEHTFS
ncbi:MAG: 3-methyl-2-oxobutanoate hydroxymethyltransferase [Gammaproteobacteria bacterium]|nr:3-methyl-2-oxobutanoate hydroxymethyltransferase [Gammaproteobacteria bacterium]MCB1923977.1 3-methyl-2-oxobutanoate hydroxymethyltransferase [Gammaproteobacteria bacterium]